MKPQKRVNTDKDLQEKLQKECKISSLSASLLIQRGITNKEQAERFLNGSLNDLTDPYRFIGMDKIIERLRKALNDKERIVVYGDYDCDGIGATAIYYLSLRNAGVDVKYYIPTRKKEGYGLNVGAIDKIIEEHHPKILLTADCGITSHEEIGHAIERGLEVIVTDHHSPTETALPCLNTDPCFTPELTQLCAAGVALYVIRALFGEDEAKKYIDICALSTIADIVPLTGDNRILVKYGLEKIRRGQTRPGIKTLIQYAKCNMRSLSVSDVSFRIAPRLNAAGRLSTPIDSLRLIIEDDPIVLSLLAENLSIQNAERQQLSATIYKEAMEQLKGYDFGKYRFIMLFGNWNEGVVGIVCSKLTEFYHVPTILLCEQEGNVLCGSARSIEDVHLYHLLDYAKDELLTYGGHAMAAGLSLKKENFPAAKDKMNERLTQLDESIFLRRVYYDEEVSIRAFDGELFDEISKFAPFGANNPMPVFFDESPVLSFKKASEKFPIIKARAPIGEVVSFDGASLLPLLEKNDYSVLYTVDKNTFNGMETPQFSIKDFVFSSYFTEDKESFFDNFFVEKHHGESKTDLLTLYVCFKPDSVENVLKTTDIDMPVYYRTTQKLERKDSVVLSPSRDFPYSFFGKIVFCDIVHPVLKQRAIEFGCKVESKNEERLNIDISIDYLRSIFVYYSKMKFFGGKNNRYTDFYNGDTSTLRSLEEFLAASYILEECELLVRDENGVLSVKSKKADPTASSVFKYLRGEL